VNLRERDTELRELMDDPECDPARLAATLRRFGIVNRLVSGWGGVYRAHLRPHLAALQAALPAGRPPGAPRRPARVLDLGCGGGDVIERLARLARRDGFDVEWLGVDPDPRAHAAASVRAGRDIAFRCTDSTTLRAEGDAFDVVLSNHVLHHLDADELRRFADDSLALSRGPVLHGDIRRGRGAYALYGVGITPLAPGTFLRTDGLRSIRRSYRPEELAHALGGSWRIETPAAFRLLAVGAGRA
jgi:2-polyprenyl-3-methyl-5-hydroxy-6-metoxy-1,4-benzoquinol methylase